MKDEQVIREILIEGRDDWVPLAVVARFVSEVTGLFGDAVIERTLEVIGTVLRSGWMTVGDIGDSREPGFQAWREPIDESLLRIAGSWRALGHEPGLGDICWFSLTPTGNATLGGPEPQRP